MAKTMHIHRNLVWALIVGLGLFGVTSILTFGFPFSFDYPHYQAFCRFTGCNTYELPFVVVDYLFWVGIAYVIVSVANRVSGIWGKEPQEIACDGRGEAKFFTALFLFGFSFLCLWLGLANSEVGISGWFIGALVLAVSGVIVLKLPRASSRSTGNDRAR